jgi:hypothetical protein
MSVMVTPDLFIGEPTNAVMAVASPVVPAVACITAPLIIPPPMAMAEEPIFPSMTPSEASSIIAVTMPEEWGIPMVIAYCEMAAMAMPWFLASWLAPAPEPATIGFIGGACRMSLTEKYAPMAVLAATMFASVMPPVMW